MKINKINVVSFLIVAASIAVIVYMGDRIRYDLYIILSCIVVAAVSFLAGFYEAKKRYS